MKGKLIFPALLALLMWFTVPLCAQDAYFREGASNWYENEDLFNEEKGITRVIVLNNGHLIWGKMVYNAEDKKVTVNTEYGTLRFYKSQTLYVFSEDESKKIIELYSALTTLSTTQKLLQQYMVRKRIGKLEFNKPYLFLMMTEGMVETVPICKQGGKIEIQNRYEPLMKCTIHGSIKHIVHQLRDLYGKTFYRVLELERNKPID